MSFQQGLSGLNGASKTLEAIGNNIANANTAGFKSSQVQFADVYANSLSGGGTSSVGIGTKVSQISQQFTQGNVSSSNNPLDMAINGNGFFGLRGTDGTPLYSRNGQFKLDQDGNIVNSSGAQLLGFAANDQGVIPPGAQASPLVIDLTRGSPPEATNTLKIAVNLDSRESIPTVAFNPANPTAGGFNSASSATVYDTKGVPHVIQNYYRKTAAGWEVYVQSDVVIPPATTPANAVLAGTLAFNTDGELTTAQPFPAPVGFALDPTGGALTPMNIRLDFTNTTEFGSAFSVNGLSQDGYAAGRLASYSIDSGGNIFGRYSNGQSQVLGQVVLYTFANPNGLQPLGNNTWGATFTSGAAVSNAPGKGDAGVLQASAVEDSNVDMTAELVNMITAQRVYQANAQTIKTQDQVLQTLVNLR